MFHSSYAFLICLNTNLAGAVVSALRTSTLRRKVLAEQQVGWTGPAAREWSWLWPEGQDSPLTTARVFPQHDELLKELLLCTMIQYLKE